MARVKRAVGSKKHRKQVLERAKGYYGNKSRSYRAAHEQVMRSMQYAFAIDGPVRATCAASGYSASTRAVANTT